jgi:hypothetical protein
MNTIDNWDMGVADDPSLLLHPRHSVLQTIEDTDGNPTTDADPSNTISDDPVFVAPFDVTVNVLASRTYPAFRQSIIVAEILPPSLMGNYHLKDTTSPAYGAGVLNQTVRWGATASSLNYVVTAPIKDIDNDARPTLTGPVLNPTRRYDAGADQYVP